MTPIPPKLRKEIDNDPFYKTCCLYGHKEHICEGRVTMEHSLIYAGKQVQEKYAIIPVCARGQEVDQFQDAHTMNKELNVWVALNRATDEELKKISKAVDYIRERDRLNAIHGLYIHQIAPTENISTYTTKNVTKPQKSPIRPMWYPVAHDEKVKIEFIMNFYADFFDTHYSPFDTIKKCIEGEYKVVKKYLDDPKYVQLLEARK